VTGREAHRLSTVLRLAAGDAFPALGPDGATYSCTVTGSGPGMLSLSIARQEGDSAPGSYKPDVRAGRAARDQAVATPSLATPTVATPTVATPTVATMPRLSLAVGFLKGSKLDDVVRAATEASVSEILPLITARSIPKDHTSGRMERMHRIMAEALSQSGSRIPTRLSAPLSIPELCRRAMGTSSTCLRLFFHEMPLAQSSIHRYCTNVPDEIIACVGPEGGFDDDEVKTLTQNGFSPAWLGPGVLRAETAAVFVISALRIVFLERSSWSTTE